MEGVVRRTTLCYAILLRCAPYARCWSRNRFTASTSL